MGQIDYYERFDYGFLILSFNFTDASEISITLISKGIKVANIFKLLIGELSQITISFLAGRETDILIVLNFTE